MEFHHIGIAVKKLTESSVLFENILETAFSNTEDVDSQKVQVTFGGGVELLQATDIHSPQFPMMKHPILSHLDKHGEGIHHICFSVENLEAKVNELKKSGIKPLTNDPIIGAGGKKAIFLHPKDCNGTLIELMEK
ncbi:MAG: VOC family protein [Leptospirales bacterium]